MDNTSGGVERHPRTTMFRILPLEPSEVVTRIAAHAVHPIVSSWVRRDVVLENLSRWLVPRDTDPVATRLGQSPPDRRKALEFGPALISGSGIEYVAIPCQLGASGRVAVDVIPMTSTVCSEEVDAMAQFVSHRWAVSPSALIRVYLRSGHPELGERHHTEYVLAAPIRTVRVATMNPRVAFVPLAVEQAYVKYNSTVAQFQSESPDARLFTSPVDYATLSVAHADGGVFEIQCGGRPAGYCYAVAAARHGLHGWLAGGVILHREFRGRGLAASAISGLSRAVPARDDEYIVAYVVPRNVASLRAAIRTGHAVIGQCVYVQ